MSTLSLHITRLRDYVVLPGLLALVTLFMVRVYPPAPVAIGLAVCCALAYLYRREWIVGALFVGLIFQNLVYQNVINYSERLGTLVKGVDDLMLVGFAVALVFEAFFPVVRPERLPQWRAFAALLLVCLLSAVVNRWPVRFAGIGTYILLKNFVWFYLAASLSLEQDRDRTVFRFLIIVLGGLMMFGFFQVATGGLTYDILNLPRDYRLGILRVRSVFVRPIYFAEAMSLLAILSITAYVYLRKRHYLWLGLAALLITGLTMMVKTIFSLDLAVGFLFLRRKRWMIVPYAVAAVSAVLFFGEYGIENIRHQFQMYIESPASVRREGYRIAGEIMVDSPWLGVGPGGFGGFAAAMLESPVSVQYGFLNYDGQVYSSIDAHWPHLLAEIGLLGLLAYVWFLWAAGRRAWTLSSRIDLPPHFRILAASAAIFLLVVVLEAFAAENIEDTLCGFMLFMMLGLAQKPPEKVSQ